MKLRNLFTSGLMAIAAMFASCQPESKLDGTKLEIDPSVVKAEAAEEEVTVNVTADCNWVVSTDAEWIKLSTERGSGNGTVTLYIAANTGAGRDALVHFQKSTTKKVSADLTVKQASGLDLKPGDGTKENPYLASQAAEVCAALADGATTPGEVYVKGYVKKFATKHSEGIEKFGNALFYITDDPDGQVKPDFYCFQVNYLGNTKFTSVDQIKLGDEVVVYGKLTNYNGTYETVGKGAAYIYSLNGKTEAEGGEVEDPTKVEQITCAKFIENADPNTTYRLVGQVTSSVNTTYCSFDMNDGTGTVVVWTVNNKDEWISKVKQGGTVTVRGKYKRFEATNGTVKHEMIDAYIEDFVEGEAPEDISTESILDVVAAPNESNVTLSNVTVVATAAKGFLVKDVADAYLFVYGEASCNAGDVVTVKGSKAVYSDMPQLTSPEVTVTGSNTITHPAAEDITATFDSFTSSSVKYISFSGTLSQSGNYYNITVDGASTKVGSLIAPSQDVSAFVNVPGVTFTGYYVYTSSSKYIYIILTEAKAGNSPYLTVSPANVTVLATATETEIAVNSNTNWTAACDNAAFALDKTQGENSATVKVTFAANEESTEKKATVTFTYDGGKTATVAITQKAAGAAGTPVYTLDTSKEGVKGSNNVYDGQGTLAIDGISWTCQGNMQMQPWRVGGKNIENVDRALYTETPMSSAIRKITFTPGNINITLNSAKLVYSQNKDFTDALEKEFTLTANTPVDIVADMPANAYYKFVFNVTNATKNNKYVEIAKIEFYAAQ
ncbi:MAG: BACON domain-containing carbohydrate-binding protein [Candidatus Cryptobacteroides sp.]|nr:BACON domain-containing carbohydrate-binding protein [Candidatus Cryptobacteroides sp.]